MSQKQGKGRREEGIERGSFMGVYGFMIIRLWLAGAMLLPVQGLVSFGGEHGRMISPHGGI